MIAHRRLKNFLLLLTLTSVLAPLQSTFAQSKGDTIHQQVISETPLYNNSKVVDFVNKVGQKLVKESQINDYEYRFFVLDDPGINAFTPGYGYIYINRGLLSFLNSEAELAGVLAHEIAHNTQRHLARKKSGMLWSNVAAFAAAFAVGNSRIADVVQTTAAVRLQGFGREMELEADEVGAEFMYNANYDPKAMLGVLGTLKDHERYRDLQSIQDGGDATYHGVFASHPRSDKRLQEVISKAGTLPPGEDYQGRADMREALDSMVVGNNVTGNKRTGYERFANKSLGVTMLYPEGWSKSVAGAKMIFKDAEQTIQLKITVEKTADKTQSSNQILTEKYPSGLAEIAEIKKDPAKDLGTTARLDQQRVAAITVGRNTYHFQGIAKNNQLTEPQDQIFQDIISTFRRAVTSDYPSGKVARIYYQRLKPGETFSDLAGDQVLGPLTEQTLRLMNGYFPSGEPEPGTWMKLVRMEAVTP